MKQIFMVAFRVKDPTKESWAAAFVVEGDRLKPISDNPNAEYTHRMYQLDDPRKVERRRLRRELITDRLRLLAQWESEIVAVLQAAAFLLHRDPRRLGEILEEVRDLRASARRAFQDLRRYAAIPTDAPRSCRCPTPPVFSLPEEVEQQTFEIPDSIL